MKGLKGLKRFLQASLEALYVFCINVRSDKIADKENALFNEFKELNDKLEILNDKREAYNEKSKALDNKDKILNDKIGNLLAYFNLTNTEEYEYKTLVAKSDALAAEGNALVHKTDVLIVEGNALIHKAEALADKISVLYDKFSLLEWQEANLRECIANLSEQEYTLERAGS